MYHYSANTVPSATGTPADTLAPAGTLAPEAPGAADAQAIVYQRCAWCATAMYHRVICPVCRGSELRTERSDGTGVVHRTTVVHRNTPSARNVSLIEMSEGFVVRGRVMGPPIAIHSGDRVRLSTAKDPVRGEPVFQLVDEPFRPWS